MYMIFRSQEAMTPLRETWERADDALRGAILRAFHRVDEQLQQDPQRRGEGRGDGSRILFQAPVGVLFEVDERQKLVRILRSWPYRVGANVPDETE